MLQNYRERERLAREAVRKVKKNVSWLFTKEGSQFFYAAHMELASIEVLVMLAREGDKNAIEILREHAIAIAGWKGVFHGSQPFDPVRRSILQRREAFAGQDTSRDP